VGVQVEPPREAGRQDVVVRFLDHPRRILRRHRVDDHPHGRDELLFFVEREHVEGECVEKVKTAHVSSARFALPTQCTLRAIISRAISVECGADRFRDAHMKRSTPSPAGAARSAAGPGRWARTARTQAPVGGHVAPLRARTAQDTGVPCDPRLLAAHKLRARDYALLAATWRQRRHAQDVKQGPACRWHTSIRRARLGIARCALLPPSRHSLRILASLFPARVTMSAHLWLLF